MRRKKERGRVRNVTPIKVDGIQFRSKLEAYCYKKLKEAGLKFDYEKVKFELMPKFHLHSKCYESFKEKGVKVFKERTNKIRPITYMPDFTNLDEGWIIECKGNPNESFPLRWKMLKKYLKDNKLKYDLYLPRSQKNVDETIEYIVKNKK